MDALIPTTHREAVPPGWDRGVLLAVCGIDGSGKSTLIQALTAWLERQGYDVALTRQPTSFYRTAQPAHQYHYGQGFQAPPECLALLAAADRLLHVYDECLPLLSAGSVVVSHRFVWATFAIFQHRGVDSAWLREINRYCPPPHATILLDCPGEIAVRRISERGGEARHEERAPRDLERIRQKYLEVVAGSALVVDATAAPSEVFERSRVYLERILPSHPHLRRRTHAKDAFEAGGP